ncbi:TonB-dependent receptor [Mucilaginibacter conchicola]|nr:carboxypeptidase regulatory-like domain-containing protein [Mucilaginibacter conchicola]
MSGTIKDTKGETLIGATIKATHQPSGTNYATTTNADGRFTIPNMRTGGPYTVTVSYIGYQSQTIDNVSLLLGQPYVLNLTLATNGALLAEVKVTASRSKLNTSKTGASTNISTTQIATLPTISRSLGDLTRTTPQASGFSFGGRDARANNLQVDGANLNNNFGLDNNPTPGGGISPISLDAISEVSVNLAPYDVRQSGFTGAGIFAVTKSGTNTFHGSAYTTYQNQSYFGTNVGNTDISSQIVNSNNKIYGMTLGGPIIKNKLFFFVNGEYEKGAKPGITFIPKGGSGAGRETTTPVADMKTFADKLQSLGYDPGAYDNFPNFPSKDHKILAKLDWNIDDVNKLTAKYSELKVEGDISSVNGSSIPTNPSFSVTGRSGTISRLPFNRFSNNSSAFNNSNYGFNHSVRTASLELNSNISSRMSNQLIATATKNRDTRFSLGGKFFPTIDIFDGAGNNYMSAGSDPFTMNNDVINNIYNITDNFTYYTGKHTLTAGVTYEYQKLQNQFMPGAAGYYAYNSLSDFVNDKAPAAFAYTFSLIPGDDKPYPADLRIGQIGAYIQDEINFDHFKLTLGLRADKANYLLDPIENPAQTALTLPDANGNPTNYNTGKWPTAPILLSPRVGFRWDVLKDNSLVVRGGTGIFTGRIPFVFLTNMPAGNNMTVYQGNITNPAQLANITFSADPSKYRNLFSPTAGATTGSGIVYIDPNFKFPSVFRTDLAIDKALGNGFTFTAEGIISKDINAVRMRNANLKTPTGVLVEGDQTRPRFVGTGTNGALLATDRYIYPGVNTALVLENTNRGYSAVFTGMLSKSFSNGFYGSLAYTYTDSKDVTANPGSQATSIFNSNPVVGTANSQELYYSQYAIPHRVVANASYRIEYAKHFASTLSLYYEGAARGNFSYVVNGDLNGDGNSTTDLMFIPKKASDVTFRPYSATVNGVNYNFTVQQQQAAFEQFIQNSPYLSKHRGEYAKRNSAFLPWYNRLDVSFLQDFYLDVNNGNSKTTRHTLQFRADVFNFPNMLNKNWGTVKQTTTTNPLSYQSVDANGVPTYQWQNINGNLVTNPFQTNISTTSTWYAQLGLRYSF